MMAYILIFFKLMKMLRSLLIIIVFYNIVKWLILIDDKIVSVKVLK